VIRERPVERSVSTAWVVWPINWGAVIAGALCAVVAAAILGLIGTAIGANATANSGRITSWSGVGFASLVYAVISSFFAFVIGGWVAGKVSGIRKAEDATLQAALAWVVATFIIVALAAMSGAVFNGWYASLAPSPAVPAVPGQPADPALATAIRNGATAAAAAFLIGLIGAVIGGWWSSGEPMTIGKYRVRIEPHPDVQRTDRTTRIG